MNKSILAALAVSVSALLAPASAMAQSDYALRAERTQINEAAGRLAQNNPGSALVFAGCVAAAMSDYNRNKDAGNATATLAGCATLGCVVTDSWSNCMSVDTQLLIYAIRVSDINDRLG